jgi:hypothetical protein
MANNKNNTRTRKRKRSKKTYRKKYRKNYRKNATKRMMVGGTGTNMFSSLFSGITGSFNIFGSRAKQEAAAKIDATRADVAGKITEAKTTLDNTKNAVADRAKCIAACAK